VTRQLTTLAKKKIVVAALEDIKARDIVAIDVRRITSMFDWIVVASADSARQTKALARHVRDKLKEAGCAIIGTEGEEGAEWVLVDSGDIVAHIMQPAVRTYYNLEELWGEGRFDRPANVTSPVAKARTRKAAAPAPGTARARTRKEPASGTTRARTRKPAAPAPGAAKARRRKPAA
jgi:ribosome-associated protein